VNVSLHRARKQHPCESYRCDELIEPGALYVRHVVFPGEEGHEEGTKPLVMRESAACVNEAGSWIRDRYGVAAFVGGRVVFDGAPGVIVDLRGGMVRVRLDATKQVVPVHPTWRLEYLDAAVAAA
jgi:hypothetical protein